MDGHSIIIKDNNKKHASNLSIHNNKDIILEVNDLKVTYKLDEGLLKAVNGVDFKIIKGRTLGIVGESGSGKSVSAKAIMQLIDRPGEVDGEISFRSRKNSEIVDIGKLNPKGKKVRRNSWGRNFYDLSGTNGSLLPHSYNWKPDHRRNFVAYNQR